MKLIWLIEKGRDSRYMWNRKMIKTRAKEVLKISYWKAFLVSLVIALVGGASGGSYNWKYGSDHCIIHKC
jgi:hypothetical protein